MLHINQTVMRNVCCSRKHDIGRLRWAGFLPRPRQEGHWVIALFCHLVSCCLCTCYAHLWRLMTCVPVSELFLENICKKKELCTMYCVLVVPWHHNQELLLLMLPQALAAKGVLVKILKLDGRMCWILHWHLKWVAKHVDKWDSTLELVRLGDGT